MKSIAGMISLRIKTYRNKLHVTIRIYITLSTPTVDPKKSGTVEIAELEEEMIRLGNGGFFNANSNGCDGDGGA